jgi:hypothetical protein
MTAVKGFTFVLEFLLNIGSAIVVKQFCSLLSGLISLLNDSPEDFGI